MSSLTPTYTIPSYWVERWQTNEIGFHKEKINASLEKHLERLTEKKSELKFFFPLCGKAVDMAWLASIGHTVVGVEFVESAIEQFFQEQNIKFTIKQVDEFKCFTSDNGKIRLYNGDFFKFTGKYESPFDCVWDRGALVALPSDLRQKYAPHILQLLAPTFRYLLVTYKYDPSLYPGPPHMVPLEEINALYGAKCHIELIDTMAHRDFSSLRENTEPHGPPTQELIYFLHKID